MSMTKFFIFWIVPAIIFYNVNAGGTVVPDRRARVHSILVRPAVDTEESDLSSQNITADAATILTTVIPSETVACAEVDHVIVEMNTNPSCARKLFQQLRNDTERGTCVVIALGLIFIVGCILILKLL